MRGSITTTSIALVIVGFLSMGSYAKCGDPGPAGPGGEGDQTIVTDRTNLDNGLPGCEKIGGPTSKCRRVRICVKSGGCNDYAPSEVVDCPVGAQWPKCKN